MFSSQISLDILGLYVDKIKLPICVIFLTSLVCKTILKFSLVNNSVIGLIILKLNLPNKLFNKLLLMDLVTLSLVVDFIWYKSSRYLSNTLISLLKL